MNPLQEFCDQHAGRGIFKWSHYFDVYHRYLQRFQGTAPHVLEIGVQSGGSLEMWRAYFGASAQICGVDVNPACQALAGDRTTIYTGDQGDRSFWRKFRQQAPKLDVVIDDGSHNPQHQIITLQELWPHLALGGVYVCEDLINARGSAFVNYVMRLAYGLNTFTRIPARQTPECPIVAHPAQAMIAGVHLHPCIVVIECNAHDVDVLEAKKYGTEWIER